MISSYNKLVQLRNKVRNQFSQIDVQLKKRFDLIPNLYDRSAYLRQIGREDLALIQDYYMYKRLLIFYTSVVRSHESRKKEYKSYLTEKLRAGRENYEKIFSVSVANPNEYKKMKIFLASPLLYRIVMYLNDTFVIPMKLKRMEKKKC